MLHTHESPSASTLCERYVLLGEGLKRTALSFQEGAKEKMMQTERGSINILTKYAKQSLNLCTQATVNVYSTFYTDTV